MEQIKIVKNNLCVDIEKLKKFIIEEWQSGYLYNFHYNKGTRGEMILICISTDIEIFLEELRADIQNNARKRFQLFDAEIDWQDDYPKKDFRSIGFELLWINHEPLERLTTDDIPMILEFIDTPPDKSLAAWAKWDAYWASLDYPARYKKLLESVEQ